MAATSGEIARLRDHDASGCRRPLFVSRSWAGPGATPIVARGARLRAARFGPTRGRRSSAGAWKRDSSKERIEGTPRRNGGSGAVVLSCCRAVVLSCCRAVVLSCCRAVVLSCCRAVVLSCCRAVVLSCCRAIARLLDCAIAWSGVRVGVRSRVRVFVRRHGRVCAERSFDRAARGARRAASGEWRVASGERRAVKGEWRRAKGERAPSGHGARRAKSACARPCGAGSHGFTAHVRGATACRFRRYRPSPTMPTSDTNASSEKNSASGSHSPR
ncbi:Uncharacterised protein [Burkholderia mallei]|nr:Uncharacterised protein [Burkholderia mallei]